MAQGSRTASYITTIIGSGNGLLPNWHQAITWNSNNLISFTPPETHMKFWWICKMFYSQYTIDIFSLKWHTFWPVHLMIKCDDSVGIIGLIRSSELKYGCRFQWAMVQVHVRLFQAGTRVYSCSYTLSIFMGSGIWKYSPHAIQRMRDMFIMLFNG